MNFFFYREKGSHPCSWALGSFSSFILVVLACGSMILFGCHNEQVATRRLPVTVPAAPPNGIQMIDTAESAGLHYRWTIPGKRPLTILQTIGNGCAFLDYDNDGNLDILLVGPKLALYKGDGHGHFTDVSHATGLDTLHGHFLGCAVGDYDNDGYDDLYISAYRGGILLHNEGGKRFRDVTAEAGIRPQPWGSSAAFADIDGDGKLDLYICNYLKFGPSSPQHCTLNRHLAACGPRDYAPERGVLYHNLGGGRFRDVTTAWGAQQAQGKGLGVAAADYDGSGHQSLAIANDVMPGDLLQYRGGKFEDVGTASGTAFDRNGNLHGGMGLDWGDYDNDGRLDLLVATFQMEAKNLYHNTGGSFVDNSVPLGLASKTMPYVAFGAKFLDVDNDGWLDILLTNGHTQDNTAEINPTTTYREPTQLFHNDNGTAYTEISAALVGKAGQPIVGRGLAVGDFDNDGKIDALVVDSEGAPLLLHNQTAKAGHWLLCRLIGTKCNRDGQGALVRAQAGDKTFLRRCGTDGSYLSASDKRVHIGLGAAQQATLTVQWPDGHQDVYKDVAADRIVTLREGASHPE
jgi:hypothetical protein